MDLQTRALLLHMQPPYMAGHFPQGLGKHIGLLGIRTIKDVSVQCLAPACEPWLLDCRFPVITALSATVSLVGFFLDLYPLTITIGTAATMQ
jgi:hypothetical protein